MLQKLFQLYRQCTRTGFRGVCIIFVTFEMQPTYPVLYMKLKINLVKIRQKERLISYYVSVSYFQKKFKVFYISISINQGCYVLTVQLQDDRLHV